MNDFDSLKKGHPRVRIFSLPPLLRKDNLI